VIKRTFGQKRDKIQVGSGKLYTEELHNLFGKTVY
jgi:hypothetical protein